jgi:hypothetical protein
MPPFFVRFSAGPVAQARTEKRDWCVWTFIQILFLEYDLHQSGVFAAALRKPLPIECERSDWRGICLLNGEWI